MKQNSSKLMEDIKKFLTGKKTDYVEIGGHRFAENIKVGQNALVLNGTGVRTQSDKPIYAVALYLPAKTHRQDTSRALLGARRVQIVILQPLNAEDFISSMREAIAENNDETYQDFIENELQQIEEFMKDLTNLEPGDVADVDWLPSRGTFVYYNGQLMGNPVRGKALYDAVLSIWLGDHALEEGLREGLLSLPKEEKKIKSRQRKQFPPSLLPDDKAARGRLLSSQEPIRNYLTNFGWIRFCVLNVASHSA